MKLNYTILAKVATVVVLVLWYGLFFVRPLEIHHGDLGRHLKNGEIVLSSILDPPTLRAFFETNFYSHTFQDFPFLNHHWGSGVIFYAVWLVGGFLGLQTLTIIVGLSTLFFFFDTARRQANFWIASAVAFFLIPLITDRHGARPEMFSYLFFGLFWWVLCRWRGNPAERKLLWLLPPVFLLWVNLHIYFIFGAALLVFFWLEAFIKKNGQAKTLGWILAVCCFAGLINPFGLRVYFYPFTVLERYGIQVQELQPVTSAAPDILHPAKKLTFQISFFSFWIGFILLFLFKRQRRWAELLAGLLFSFLAWKMVRNLSLFALFMLPLLSVVAGEVLEWVLEEKKYKKQIIGVFGLLIVLGTLLLNRQRLPSVWNAFSVDAISNSETAAVFVRDNKIKGNLFNDFDSGGYTIFYLYPELRPFVDNRPEAYPVEFFQEEYYKARLDEDAWQKVVEKYHLNVLLLSMENKSQLAVPFIARRVEDPFWAPVFVDDKFIVFVKRSDENKEVIDGFEIPRERFEIIER